MKTLSYSELDRFNQCRQAHDWQYNKRLQSKEESEPLTVGLLGHTALAAYYSQEDWKKALHDYRDGLLVSRITDPPVLPQNEEEDDFYYETPVSDLNNLTAMIEDVMERYILKWGCIDREWEVLEVEKRFEIPITDEVTLVGVWDLIVKDRDRYLWIVDHKFPLMGFRDSVSLQLDSQVGIYQWAAREYGYDTLGFIYNELKRTSPKIPSENKNKNKYGGYMSLSEVNTDWDTWRQTAILRGESHLLPQYELEMIPKLGSKSFFNRTHIYRTPLEVENFLPQLKARVADLLSGNVFMVPQRWGCEKCDYKGLCLETLKGEDVQGMIESDFIVRPKREAVDEAVREELVK